MSVPTPTPPGEPTLARRTRAPHLGPAKRRPLVLDSALTLLVERGFEATSMGAIAEASGVTKPVVYECFASKRELFDELLEREERRIVTAITAAMPQIEPGAADIEEVLRRTFVALLTGARENPDSWRIVFDPKGGSDPLVEQRRRAVRSAAVERLELEIRRVVDARNQTSDPERLTAVLAEALISISEAGVRMLLSADAAWSPEELGRLLARVCARGVESL